MIKLISRLKSIFSLRKKPGYTAFIFSLSYGKRVKERAFIQKLMGCFEENLLNTILIANNNPYNLELFLYIEFKGNVQKFDDWLEMSFKAMYYRRSVFKGDIFSMINDGGYTAAIGFDALSINEILVSEVNPLFDFPDEKLLNEIWVPSKINEKFSIFLCYSGKDKKIIQGIFNDLQNNEIRCFYADYEIEYGESIVKKINHALTNSDLGVICLSKNFFNSTTNWPDAEKNYFINCKRAMGKKDLIFLNLDLEQNELPDEYCTYSDVILSYEKDKESFIKLIMEKQINELA